MVACDVFASNRNLMLEFLLLQTESPNIKNKSTKLKDFELCLFSMYFLLEPFEYIKPKLSSVQMTEKNTIFEADFIATKTLWCFLF